MPCKALHPSSAMAPSTLTRGSFCEKQLLALAAAVALLAGTVGGAVDYCTVCDKHTLCIYKGVASKCQTSVSKSGVGAADQQVIVDEHNRLRNLVASGQEGRGKTGPQPPAANMQRLKWDDELATIAQRWVDQCNYGHDACRNTANTYVGQNAALFGSSPCSASSDLNAAWQSPIQSWYNEVGNMDKAKVDSFSSDGPTIGHYTQVVWGDTTKIGCGYRLYQDGSWCQKYYVCNYATGGNWVGSPVYKKGSPRTQCASQGQVDSKYPALC